MQALRAHHFNTLLILIEGAFSRMSWDKDLDADFKKALETVMRSEFTRRANHCREVLVHGGEDDEIQSAIDYIGPKGENYDRFIQTYMVSFGSIINEILYNPQGTLRIQTDPADVCEGCWLADKREVGLHCLQDLNLPAAERNHFFPLYNIDVLNLQVLSERLGLEIIEEPGRIDGIRNMYIDVRCDVLRELIIRNGEFSSKILFEMGRALQDAHEKIGLFNFDYLFYVFKRRG